MNNFTHILLIAFLILNMSISAQSNDFQFNAVDKVINKAIEDKSFPGAVVLVWKDGKTIYEKVFGNYTYYSLSPKVKRIEPGAHEFR